MLPFYFIKKITPLKTKLISMYDDRANQIAPRILPFISSKDKILDLGCGTGALSKTLKKNGRKNITLVDVDYNEMCDLYPVTIYDGYKLPFKNKQFDKTLLITVLHHCSDAETVLDEAARMTKGRIIVMEDIFTDLPSRLITLIGDCLVNWEIHSPFRNHTKEGWIKIFKEKGFKVEKIKEFKLRCIGFPFKLAIFVLIPSKTPRKIRRLADLS